MPILSELLHELEHGFEPEVSISQIHLLPHTTMTSFWTLENDPIMKNESAFSERVARHPPLWTDQRERIPTGMALPLAYEFYF